MLAVIPLDAKFREPVTSLLRTVDVIPLNETLMRQKKRKPNRKKQRTSTSDVAGALLLEVVAVVALLFVIWVSGDTREERVELDNRAYRTADIGAAVTGFFSDQLDRSLNQSSR